MMYCTRVVKEPSFNIMPHEFARMMEPARSDESQSLKELWGEYSDSTDLDDLDNKSDNPFDKKYNPLSR